MNRKENFPDTKVSTLKNVHYSVSCTVVFMKHVQSGYSCIIESPLFTIYPWQKENQKHPKYEIFSFLSVPVCRTRPAKIRMFVNQLYPKLLIMHKKWRFHDTPVKLVENVHRFSSCAIGQVMLHSSAIWPCSTKAKYMVKSMVSVLSPFLCTKDLQSRWAAKWFNCDQIHTLFTNNEVSMNH